MPTPIPGPKGDPIFGMTFPFWGDPWEYAESMRAYGDLVRLKLPFGTLHYLLHPDMVGRVLLHNQKNYTKGALLRERARALLGEGLLLAEGEQWRRQRTRMAPAFTPRAVAGLVPGILTRIRAELDGWKDAEVRAVHEDMTRLTLEVALGTLFGTSAGADVATIGDAFKEIVWYLGRPSAMVGLLPQWLPTAANRRYKGAMANLESVSTRILAERRARGELGTDLLGMLLAGRDDDGTAMDDAQLRDELRGLIIAGHETTSMGLTATLWLLAGHPEIQDAMAAEVTAAAGDGPLLPEHAERLGLAERVFKEGLRLYPPVPIMYRETIAEDTLGEYTLPPGTTVVIFPWLIHRDPRFWPDPTRFDPDRWLDDTGRHRFSWVPFAAGPRGCIGQAMAMTEGKLVLAEILRRFRLERADPGELVVVPELTLRPRGPVRLKLTAR